MKSQIIAALVVSAAIGYFGGTIASSAVPARMGSGDVVYVSADDVYAKGVTDGIDEMIRIFNETELVLSLEEIGEMAKENLFVSNGGE